jgi:hypothetical protein
MCRIFKVRNGEELRDNAQYKSIIKHLVSYQKMGDKRNWDEYKNGIDNDLLEKWTLILIDCRRNGFIGPRMEFDRMIWMQVLTHGSMTSDLCTLCDRACKRREDLNLGMEWERMHSMRDKGLIYNEPRACWQRA